MSRGTAATVERPAASGATVYPSTVADRVQELIHRMVASVVDTPESIEISREVGEFGNLNFRVTVADDEIGQALGKEGRIAQGIRVIAKAAAMKERVKVYVEIEGCPSEHRSAEERR